MSYGFEKLVIGQNKTVDMDNQRESWMKIINDHYGRGLMIK